MAPLLEPAADERLGLRAVVRHGVFTNTGDGLNLVHAGDLIKLSFGLAGNRGLDILAAGSPSSTAVSCPSWTPHSVKEQSLPTGLSYNPATKHYLVGWQTQSAWAGTCRRFDLQLKDGTAVHSATFQFFA